MSGASVYKETAVMTQDKGRLVVMLYEGAIKHLHQAMRAIETNDREKKGKLICKAQDIIFELNTVLDMEAGGEIAGNLRKLYNFMWQHLGQANLKSDSHIVGEVVDLLVELNEGWKAIAS
jgi:flagellar protein FliS